MKQQEIDYKDIVRLGFTENKDPDDKVYFNKYGFEYVIITKQLTKNIYLDWPKQTRICEMVRTDSEGYIESRMPIRDAEHLEVLINFFGCCEEEEKREGEGYEVLEEFRVDNEDKIFSIKRLSDGRVFTIGDKVDGGKVENQTIKWFVFSDRSSPNIYASTQIGHIALPNLKHHRES